MLSYRPPIESRKNFLACPCESLPGYQSLMTRHSLYALFQSLPQKNIILPRFVPGGVYQPVRRAGKRIFYYDVPNSLFIDQQTIDTFGLDPKDTIFYYIHQFGSFIAENINFMRAMQSRGFFVVDDRSLTLPATLYREFADATAYSYYKLVGIPFGGEVRTKAMATMQRSTPDDFSVRLRKKMTANFYFYATPLLASVPAFPYRAYNKLFSKHISYSCMLDQDWADAPSQFPSAMRQKLGRVNFERITRRRIEIADMYSTALPRQIQLPVPSEALTTQSMLGFPILVSNPVALHKQLVRTGIFTTLFTNIWWWDSQTEPNELYKRNVVLPAHQRLTDQEVWRIIRTVRSFVA